MKYAKIGKWLTDGYEVLLESEISGNYSIVPDSVRMKALQSNRTEEFKQHLETKFDTYARTDGEDAELTNKAIIDQGIVLQKVIYGEKIIYVDYERIKRVLRYLKRCNSYKVKVINDTILSFIYSDKIVAMVMKVDI